MEEIMATSKATKKKCASKIPKFNRSQLVDISRLPATNIEFRCADHVTSSRDIFDKKSPLINACEFLSHLKLKLENDSNPPHPQEKSVQRRTTFIVNNLINAMVGITDQLTPFKANVRTRPVDTSSCLSAATTDRNLEFNKTTNIMHQHYTVNTVQELTSTPLTAATTEEKICVDKTLLTQLKNLHELLKETLGKLTEKDSTLTEKVSEEEGANIDEIMNLFTEPDITSPELSEDYESQVEYSCLCISDNEKVEQPLPPRNQDRTESKLEEQPCISKNIPSTSGKTNTSQVLLGDTTETAKPTKKVESSLHTTDSLKRVKPAKSSVTFVYQQSTELINPLLKRPTSTTETSSEQPNEPLPTPDPVLHRTSESSYESTLKRLTSKDTKIPTDSEGSKGGENKNTNGSDKEKIAKKRKKPASVADSKPIEDAVSASSSEQAPPRNSSLRQKISFSKSNSFSKAQVKPISSEHSARLMDGSGSVVKANTEKSSHETVQLGNVDEESRDVKQINVSSTGGTDSEMDSAILKTPPPPPQTTPAVSTYDSSQGEQNDNLAGKLISSSTHPSSATTLPHSTVPTISKRTDDETDSYQGSSADRKSVQQDIKPSVEQKNEYTSTSEKVAKKEEEISYMSSQNLASTTPSKSAVIFEEGHSAINKSSPPMALTSPMEEGNIYQNLDSDMNLLPIAPAPVATLSFRGPPFRKERSKAKNLARTLESGSRTTRIPYVDAVTSKIPRVEETGTGQSIRSTETTSTIEEQKPQNIEDPLELECNSSFSQLNETAPSTERHRVCTNRKFISEREQIESPEKKLSSKSSSMKLSNENVPHEPDKEDVLLLESQKLKETEQSEEPTPDVKSSSKLNLDRRALLERKSSSEPKQSEKISSQNLTQLSVRRSVSEPSVLGETLSYDKNGVRLSDRTFCTPTTEQSSGEAPELPKKSNEAKREEEPKKEDQKPPKVTNLRALEEVEFLDKDAPIRYFEQVIADISMMRNCIEFAMDHQLSVHEKIKAYIDDGSFIKSRFPHFHTVVDGVPILLVWKEDPGRIFLSLKRKKSSSIREFAKKLTICNKREKRPCERRFREKGTRRNPERVNDSKLKHHFLPTVKTKTKEVKKKRAPACLECASTGCHGTLDPFMRTCDEYPISATRHNRKPRPPSKYSTSQRCACDDPTPIVSYSYQRIAQKSYRKPLSVSIEEENEHRKKKKKPSTLDKTVNVPTVTNTRAMQTYFITTSSDRKKLKKVEKPQKKEDDNSDSDMPYLIGANSLPQFEYPEAVCSSKKFDVESVDCKLRKEIDHRKKCVRNALLKVNMNALLDSFRPAKCCKKVVLNGRTRSAQPYPASLQSLPLSEEDLDRILEIIQSKQKRFDTVKRLYETPLNFQREDDIVQAHFFEFFKKTEEKPSTATSSTSTNVTQLSSDSGVKHDLRIFEFIKRIYTSHPIVDKHTPSKKKEKTKTLYRHHSHRRIKHHHHRSHKKSHHNSHHRTKKPEQVTTSTSMMPITTDSSPSMRENKPVRNISFLLVPKSQLSSYFCGDISSMYSPSLNSLPFDESDLPTFTQPCNLSMVNDEDLTPAAYAKTLDAIFELDEKEYECSQVQTSERTGDSFNVNKPKNILTSYDAMTYRLSATVTDFPKPKTKAELKPEMDSPESSSTSSICTQPRDIPLSRKSMDSDLSIRKHIFSTSNILSEKCSSRIPISCLPGSCSIKDNRSSILNHLPNLIPEAKKFLCRQKEELFKPNLDSIVERSSEASTIGSNISSRRKKRLTPKRSTSPLLHFEKPSPTAIGCTHQNSRPKKGMNGFEMSLELEMVEPKELNIKKMSIDKAVVAYAISPSSEFTFISEDGLKVCNKNFKSENICVWPVFQNRVTRKRNSAFVVSIHSSAVRVGKKDSISPLQIGDQPGVLREDYCNLYKKRPCLTIDNFHVGYIGEAATGVVHRPTRETIEHMEEKERVEKMERWEKTEREKKKKSNHKESIASFKSRSTAQKKSSRKIIPEVVDIKMPANVKASRLKHKFCNDSDRPGYVTVLSTPCNCPDVTIFIPCYCQECETTKNKNCRPKTESDYAMVPILEHNESQHCD